MIPGVHRAAVNETFLGDGVYASFAENRQTIWLRTPHPEGNYWIALTPDTLKNLLTYVERTKA